RGPGFELVPAARPAEDLELVGVVLVEECDGDAHGSLEVVRNVRVPADVDRVVVVVARVLVGAVPLVESYGVVPLGGVEVRKPGHVAHGEVSDAVRDLDARLSGGVDVVGGDPEPLLAAVLVAEPDPIILYEPEDLTVRDRVLVAENEELLVV